VPSDPIATKSRALPIGPIGRKFGPCTLVPNSVVPERHPLFAELFRRHSRAIVLYNYYIVVRVLWDDDRHFSGSGIPSIRHKFGKSGFRGLCDRAKGPNEKVLFK
jgi:hypothetical protein